MYLRFCTFPHPRNKLRRAPKSYEGNRTSYEGNKEVTKAIPKKLRREKKLRRGFQKVTKASTRLYVLLKTILLRKTRRAPAGQLGNDFLYALRRTTRLAPFVTFFLAAIVTLFSWPGKKLRRALDKKVTKGLIWAGGKSYEGSKIRGCIWHFARSRYAKKSYEGSS